MEQIDNMSCCVTLTLFRISWWLGSGNKSWSEVAILFDSQFVLEQAVALSEIPSHKAEVASLKRHLLLVETRLILSRPRQFCTATSNTEGQYCHYVHSSCSEK